MLGSVLVVYCALRLLTYASFPRFCCIYTTIQKLETTLNLQHITCNLVHEYRLYSIYAWFNFSEMAFNFGDEEPVVAHSLHLLDMVTTLLPFEIPSADAVGCFPAPGIDEDTASKNAHRSQTQYHPSHRSLLGSDRR